MKKLWWNDYIGIPYKKMGNSKDGCDCWGLIELVYKNEFNITIPSFTSEMTDYADCQGIGLIPMGMETLWDKTDNPQTGDVISFRILGREQHVGIVTSPGYMLHTFNSSQTSCIEPYMSRKWKNRIAGFYHYAHVETLVPDTSDGISIIGKPHPLKPRVTSVVLAGQSLEQIINNLCDEMNVPMRMRQYGAACVNLKYIPRDQWATTFPMNGDAVVFRIHGVSGGGNPFKAILGIVLVVAAAALTWWAGGAGAGIVGGFLGVTDAVAGTLMSVVSLGLTMAGMALLNNSIASKPIPPTTGGFVDGKFLAGGNNTNRIYETLPQVLGIGRMTFDYLGQSYTEQADPYTNYLRAIFTAGYGPVEIDDIRNGDTPLSKYNNVQLNVYNGFGNDQTPKLYTNDPNEQSIGITLGKNIHNYRVTTTDVDQVQVVLYWPQGLWYRNDRGDKSNVTNTGIIRYRAVNGEWHDLHKTVRGKSISFPVCELFQYHTEEYHRIPNPEWNGRYYRDKYLYTDIEEIPLYKWYTITVQNGTCNICSYGGGVTDRQYADASEDYRVKRYGRTHRSSRRHWGPPPATPRLASVPINEQLLAYVCVKGNKIIEVIDKRDTKKISGCTITSTGRTIQVATGTIENAGVTTWSITKRDEMRAFTRVFTFDVSRGQYEIDVMLTSADDKEKAGWSGNAALQVQWLALRSFTFRTPFIPRKPLAWFEMRIRATDQLSGRLEEVNGHVGSIVLDYDYKTDTWVKRVSDNPASLFRHVLQGPAMADEYRVDDAHIDLEKLKDWHNYCRIQGFTFFKIVGADSGLSVYELLVQIAAAGYAKPLLKPDEGGIWTVWVDEPQTTVLQHFTEHNTWGVQWTKRNIDIPHAIRATFINKDKWFERDTVTVYVDGHDERTATKYENWGIEYFEGVTDIKNVQRICRRALAYAKLRPENLSFMCAMEYLTSQPGDLVRVTNSFVQWGLSSGWIVDTILNTDGAAIGLHLSESVTMTAGNEYSIRIRQAAVKGTSLKTDLQIPTETSQTREVYFATPLILQSTIPSDMNISEIVGTIVDAFPASGDLYQFGFMNKESHECLIESIVPESGDIARITVCDYSPELYDIDDGPLPEYDAGITRPEKLPQIVVSKPVFVSATSDEQVLLVGQDGSLTPRLAIVWKRPDDCQDSVAYIQFRYRLSAGGAPTTIPSDEGVNNGDPSEPGSWFVCDYMPIENTTAFILPVTELYKYDADARFMTQSGLLGEWSPMVRDFLIIGKTTLPPTVQNFHGSVQSPLGILLEWNDLGIADIAKYRVFDAAFAETSATQVIVQVTNRVGHIPFKLVAIDTGGRVSKVPAETTVEVFAPKLVADFAAITRTDGLYLTWNDCTTTWPIRHYVIKDLYTGEMSKELKSQYIVSPRAVGNYEMQIQAMDIFDNYGQLGIFNFVVNQPSAPVATTEINNGVVRIAWKPVDSSFPVKTYQVYSVDGQLLQETASTFFDVDGPSGILEYRIRAVDSAGNTSAFTEVSLELTAPEAPAVSVRLNNNRDGLIVEWTTPASMLPLVTYDVIRQWGDAEEYDYGSTDSTTMTVPPLLADRYSFMVRAVDASGNRSPWGVYEIDIRVPDATMFTDINVIDNNVQLYWAEPSNQFFAISHYLFGSVEDGYFSLIGRIDARFASRFEHTAGRYTYRVCPVDVAGNVGKCGDISAQVSQPPDFILYIDTNSVFNGEIVNGVLDGKGNMILPVDSNATWANQIAAVNELTGTSQTILTWDHKVKSYPLWMSPPVSIHSDSWRENVERIKGDLQNPSGKVTWSIKQSSGYPEWIDPTRSTVHAPARYTEIFDAGALIPSTKVTITISSKAIEASAKLKCSIYSSQDEIAWTPIVEGGFSGYATSFRFIKLVLDASDGLVAISNINLRLDVKKISDYGKVESFATDNGDGFISVDETPDLYGTWVPFAVSFTDVQSGPMVYCNDPKKHAYINFKDTLRPTGFRVFVLDESGNRVDGTVSWSAHGV